MHCRRLRQRRAAGLVVAWVFLMAASLSGGAAPAFSREPKVELKETIDKVLGVLKNSAYKGDDKREVRRQKLREVIGPRFDFAEMAKRSLARYWRQRTPEEQKEFVEVFSDLLERSYVSKIEGYTDEKIEYPHERVEDRYAEVKTKIVPQSGRDIPIDYRLHKTPTGWRVYDVVIEGVSLVSNYRGQFNRIIRKDSYKDLLQRMKNKQEDIRSNRDSKGDL